MNWLDILIMVFWIFGFLLGWKIGLFGAIFTTGSLLAGIFLAARFSDDIAELLTNSVSSDTLATIIAYGVILFMVFVVGQALRFIVKGMLKMVLLGWVEKVGALAFGLVAGVILSGALIILLARYSNDLPVGVLDDVPNGSAVVGRDWFQEKLNTAMMESTMIPVFLDVRSHIPGEALGFVPNDFKVALDMLEAEIESKDT